MGTSIFLSYARGDDAEFVERLHTELIGTGLRVWWDRETMRSRGLSFLQEIRDAIEASDRVVAIVGPAAVGSDYVRAEWDHALQFGKGVVPVLRLGDFTLLPDEFSRYHCVDFREARPHVEALHELLRVLRDPVVAIAPFLTAVPALPPHHRPRKDDLATLERLVLADTHRPVVIHPARQSTAICGMGGIGKSVLAAAFARSTNTRRSLCDGVLWLRLGPRPDLQVTFRTLGQALGDDHLHYLDLQVALNRLPALLQGRRILLVLDDVWDIEHVASLADALGPRCRLIFTTRDATIATSLGANEHSLQVLSDSHALALFADWIGIDPRSLPAEASVVAKECGGLPLALALCGAMVRDGTPWSDILTAFRDADLAFVAAGLPNYDYPHAFKALQASVDMLARQDGDIVVRYLELAVFGEEESVPQAAVLTLWCRKGALTERAARRLLVTLGRRSLLQLGRPGTGDERPTISLHDLQRDYVRAKCADIRGLHRSLLDAYRDLCEADWQDGPGDGYFHSHLLHHLREVGDDDSVRRLLLDFRWHEARLSATGVHGLLDDFGYAQESAAREIKRALRQSAHAISDENPARSGPAQLAPQLLGRLLDHGDAAIHRYCSEVTGAMDHGARPWLRPLGAVIRSAPSLLATLTGHTTAVKALVVLPDGRLASGSEDGTVRIWNLGTGIAEVSLNVHGSMVTVLAVLPDGRLAAGSADAMIRLWDVDSGKESGWLAGHGGRITALAVLHDGRLASGSLDRTIKVWNLRSGTVEMSLEGHRQPVCALATLRDGRLASSSWDDTVKFWNVNTGRAEVTLGHSRFAPSFYPLALLADSRLAVGNPNRVLDPTTGDTQVALAGGQVIALAALPDGRLAASSWKSEIRIFDLATGNCELRLEAHADGVPALAAFPDGRLASGSVDRTVKIWRPAAGSAEPAATTHTGITLAHPPLVDIARDVPPMLAVLPDGRLAAGSNPVEVWDVGGGKMEDSIRIERERGDRKANSLHVTALACFTDGTLALGTSGGAITLWRPCSPRVAAEVRIHSHSYDIAALAVLPDGRLVSGSRDGSTKVWRSANASAEATFKKSCATLAALPDGFLASASSNGTSIDIWDAETGQTRHELKGHAAWVTALVALPDGRLVSGDRDGTVMVWDCTSDRPVFGIDGHTRAITAFAVLPKLRLASASRDGALIVSDLGAAKPHQVALLVLDWPPTGLVVLPDGVTLAVARKDNRVHLLRLEEPARGPATTESRESLYRRPRRQL